eukprot:3025849-Rhodomonas_salina.2
MVDSRGQGKMDDEGGPMDEPRPSSSAAWRSVVVFWGGVALIQFAAFCFLRNNPRFKKLYNVRDSVEKLRCSLASKDLGSKWNLLAWIPAVLRATDDEIFEQVGLDGLCYTRVVHMGIKLSLLGCFVAVWLIPTYFTSPKVLTIQKEGGYIQEIPLSNANVTDFLDRMSMGNTYQGDPRMFAGVVAAYLMSVYGMMLLHQEYNWFIVQRHRWLERRAPENYSIYVDNIPPSLRSKTALREYFSVCLDDILEIQMVQKVPELERLCARRAKLTAAVKHSEALLAQLKSTTPSAVLPLVPFARQ